MIKYARAPVRIDFAGGTTDIYPFAHKFGGAVLNAAINKYVYGKLISTKDKTILSYYADIPTSSGLGTSSAMNAVWLSLVSNIKDKIKIAETVYKLENSIYVVGGKQDQYAASLGGINFLEFKNDKTFVTKINLNKNTLSKLQKNLLLVYTGPRLSSDINAVICKKFAVLKELKQIAIDMKKSLLSNNLERFSSLMNEEWSTRKKLHPLITNKKLNKLINIALNNGAISAKVCGAAGGGSILFYCHNKDKLKSKLKKEKIIDFKFDFSGLVTR